jgi:hypothetical protein
VPSRIDEQGERGGASVAVPPLLTAGKPHALPTERRSLTVSVVICASTEGRWPLLQGTVSSPEPDPDGKHRLRQSQRFTARRVPTAQGAPRRKPLRSAMVVLVPSEEHSARYPAAER